MEQRGEQYPGRTWPSSPVHDTTIEGSIEKGDGSAGTMDVEILNGGAVISKSTTTKPYGSVELHVAWVPP